MKGYFPIVSHALQGTPAPHPEKPPHVELEELKRKVHVSELVQPCVFEIYVLTLPHKGGTTAKTTGKKKWRPSQEEEAQEEKQTEQFKSNTYSLTNKYVAHLIPLYIDSH